MERPRRKINTEPDLDPRHAFNKMLPWAILIAIVISIIQWLIEKKN